MLAAVRTKLALLVGLAVLFASPYTGCVSAAEPPRDDSDGQSLLKGREAFDKGDFERAIAYWRAASESAEKHGDPAGQIQAMVDLASAYQALGQHNLSIGILENALACAEKLKDPRTLALVKNSLGVAYSLSRMDEAARSALDQALALAKTCKDDKLSAAILNNLGNLLAQQNQSDAAIEHYKASAALAHEIGDNLQAAKALANAAAAAIRANRRTEAEPLLTQALNQLPRITSSHEQAYLLIQVGQSYQQLGSMDLAETAYQQAARSSQRINDTRAACYAWGHLGQIAETRHEYASALDLTRQAVLLAQQIQSPEALYRWEWQTGRLLKAQGQLDPAIAAYRRAVDTLESIRIDLAIGHGNRPAVASFREAVGPVYFQLADLLLQRADSERDPQEVQQSLREARQTIELLKAVELEDYFQDECCSLVRSKNAGVEEIDPEAAVIYLIPLPDRTELLLSYATGMERYKVPVSAEQVTAEVRQFRRNLETRTSHEYLIQAQHLYDWFIRPIKPSLSRHKSRTLVLVPDGALRTVPLAALHDGQQFLIQEFAVAVTPGLSLTDPQPSKPGKTLALLGGVSKPVQGFSTLDYVPAELRAVQRLYRNETLMDQQFLLDTLQTEFGAAQFSVVHIASHGQFDREVAKTFVLTYDSKLKLDDLERLVRPSQFHGRPVDLLVLSACQTAAGDDRAALGLAGVAVKAGARSALATLWFVNDQASTSLISEFYAQWTGTPSVSKAEALRQAQRKLLADRRYRHPCYWAPYVIIGNWL